MAEGGFCEACGAELHEGAHFCGKCGHVVGSGEAATTQTDTAATPAAPAAAPAAVAAGGLPKWVLPLVLGVAALAIVALVVVLVAGGGDDGGTAKGGGTEIGQGAVLLEPINAPVPNPFTGSSTTGTEPAVQTAALPAGVPARAGSGGQVNGSAPGLYGGSGNAAVCDRNQLVRFLEANPAKARAWAGVLGITTAQIRDYVASLTPVLLTTDTLVLNHGYANGKATPRNSVLQAGTAVLVDKYGIPRVKCGCGNPLLPPTLSTATRIRGTRWPGFQPQNVTTVVSADTINIFVIVNVTNGQLTDRPAGTDGTQDTAILIDRACDLFPNDPTCATTSTSTTLPLFTPPTAAPTPAEPAPLVNDPLGAAIDYLNGEGNTYAGECSAVGVSPDYYCLQSVHQEGDQYIYEMWSDPFVEAIAVAPQGTTWVVVDVYYP